MRIMKLLSHLMGRHPVCSRCPQPTSHVILERERRQGEDCQKSAKFSPQTNRQESGISPLLRYP
jgi:hypothetical protein